MQTKKKRAALITASILFAIVLMPLLLTCFLLIILYTPIDYLRFRMSAFRKETGHKYRWIITTASTYRIHRIITNEGLSIKYYKDKEDDGTTGFFVSGNTLLAYGIGRGSLSYDESAGVLVAFCRDRRQYVYEYLKDELQRFEEKYGIKLSSAKALYSLGRNFENSDKMAGEEYEKVTQLAESSGMLCLYDGKRSLYEALISFNSETATVG